MRFTYSGFRGLPRAEMLKNPQTFFGDTMPTIETVKIIDFYEWITYIKSIGYINEMNTLVHYFKNVLCVYNNCIIRFSFSYYTDSSNFDEYSTDKMTEQEQLSLQIFKKHLNIDDDTILINIWW